MTRFAEQQRDALLEGMLPGFGAHDHAPFFAELDRAAPPLLKLGLFAAVWGLGVLGPLLLLGRLATARGLAGDDRERLVARAAAHDLYLVRQLALALKLVACFGWFQVEGARRP